MTKGYRKGIRLVRFPGGRVARFHKPGTKAFAKGEAAKKAAGRRLAKLFGIPKKKGRKTRRNPRAHQDCHVCGEPFSIDSNGVANHVTKTGAVDYDADAQHVAYALDDDDQVWHDFIKEKQEQKKRRNPQYGQRADYRKIDLYVYGKYVASTNQSKSLKEAIRKFKQSPMVATLRGLQSRGGNKVTAHYADRRNPPQRKSGERYNGWKNYATWNVSLWINNDEGIYNDARRFMRRYSGSHPYDDYIAQAGLGAKTPDGVAWDAETLGTNSLDDMMREL